MATKLVIAFLLYLLLPKECAAQDNKEISLFDGSGNASAYIATLDDLTIYTWDGLPSAYLEAVSTNTFNVYGFNGSHLALLWQIFGGNQFHVPSAVRTSSSIRFEEVIQDRLPYCWQGRLRRRPIDSFFSARP